MKKSIKKSKIGKIVFLITVLSVISGCSGGIEVQSTLNENTIKIDGNRRDWGSSINYLKDDNIAFGFKNDKDNLYIGLVTADRAKIMKILSMGLTVWLETDKDKLGIKFPLSTAPEEMHEMRMNRDTAGTGNRIKNLLINRRDLQVINEDDLPLYTGDAEEGPDFTGKIGYEDEQLVYEIKIPLRNNKLSERIFDEATGEVEINFATGKFERNFNGGNRMGTNPGMGFPPQGEGRNMGGMRGRRPSGEEMNFEPLDYKFDLLLNLF